MASSVPRDGQGGGTRGATWAKRAADAGAWALLLLGLAFFLFPIYWTIVGTFKDKGQFFTYPPVMWPTEWGLENVRGALAMGGAKGISDSLIVALAATVVSMAVGSLAAYALARYRVGGPHLAFWILSIRMFPPIASALPLFLFMRSLRILDTHLALILTYTMMNLPFVVWMMRGFFQDLPRELEEAALTDGCSRFGVFTRVAFPLAAPGLVATALFCFIFSWNEFLFALILTRSRVQTLPVVIPGLVGGHEILWGEISAISTIAIVPVIVLAFALQRYLVRGLTLGALKG